MKHASKQFPMQEQETDIGFDGMEEWQPRQRSIPHIHMTCAMPRCP
jgi:hypothetical protein